jgi:hypothetical protein
MSGLEAHYDPRLVALGVAASLDVHRGFVQRRRSYPVA